MYSLHFYAFIIDPLYTVSMLFIMFIYLLYQSCFLLPNYADILDLYPLN